MEDIHQQLALIQLKILNITQRLDALEKQLPEYVTPKELARIMNCSVNHVYTKMRKGEIETIDVAGVRRIPLAQFTEKNINGQSSSKYKSQSKTKFLNELEKFVWK